MNRLAWSLALVGAFLFASAPALAAKPIPATATVSVSPEAPVYGDIVTLTVTTDASPSYVAMVCTHAFGQSYSFSVTNYSSPYSDEVGLYAPNWPSGGASCVAEVKVFGHGHKDPVIGSLTFAVGP